MGGLGAIITIILVVAWVVKGLSSVMGENETEKKRPHRSLEEWDELQAQRRAEMSDQQEALSQMRAQSSQPDPSQMTMAERIELARQRARQQAGVQDQGDNDAQRREQAMAERRAKEQREAELRARQRRAQQDRAEQQQRAQRERARQQRRRQAQQQAEREAQAQRQRRAKQQRRTKPRATTGSKRESVVAESVQRVHSGHEHGTPAVAKLASGAQSINAPTVLGTLDRDALRKAFIMKELLDKPLALRDPQADLPS